MTDRQAPNRSKRDLGEDFARQAERPSPGIVREFIEFLRYNKKWWLIPILLVLLLVGVLVALSAGPAGLLIYTVF